MPPLTLVALQPFATADGYLGALILGHAVGMPLFIVVAGVVLEGGRLATVEDVVVVLAG